MLPRGQLRLFKIPVTDLQIFKRSYTAGDPGSGASKGGGTGGSIRESDGGLGKYGAVQEDGYFFNKQKELLEKLRKQLKESERTLSASQKEPEPK